MICAQQHEQPHNIHVRDACVKSILPCLTADAIAPLYSFLYFIWIAISLLTTTFPLFLIPQDNFSFGSLPHWGKEQYLAVASCFFMCLVNLILLFVFVFRESTLKIYLNTDRYAQEDALKSQPYPVIYERLKSINCYIYYFSLTCFPLAIFNVIVNILAIGHLTANQVLLLIILLSPLLPMYNRMIKVSHASYHENIHFSAFEDVPLNYNTVSMNFVQLRRVKPSNYIYPVVNVFPEDMESKFAI